MDEKEQVWVEPVSSSMQIYGPNAPKQHIYYYN